MLYKFGINAKSDVCTLLKHTGADCIINAKMPTHPKEKQKHLIIIYIHIKPP